MVFVYTFKVVFVYTFLATASHI